MKKIAVITVSIFALLLALSGCKHIGSGVKGSGARKTEKRDLKSFKSIDTEGAYEIDVTCQKPASFEIEGDDNILPLIKTEVRDGVLYVTSDRNYNSSQMVSLRIALPDLERVTTRGASKAHITDVKTESLTLNSKGAAKVDAAGQVKLVKIQSEGAGKIDAGNLHAEKAKVTASGAASVDVYASEQLDVDLSGAGRVVYSGNPKTVNKNVSGIGIVTPK